MVFIFRAKSEGGMETKIGGKERISRVRDFDDDLKGENLKAANEGRDERKYGKTTYKENINRNIWSL